ncbi:MAG: hypothetical protein LC118_03570 [Dehalococcoidia bacterium]|nr:hypothetical protein [Dehalococcoidia bacterium]
MVLKAIAWKLASPYDAYVSHVARLNQAMERIRYFTGLALGYEAGLHGSVRLVPAPVDPLSRAQRFREQLGQAASAMGDEEFEAFLTDLGGGSVADVETDRARTVTRLANTTRGLEEYFAIAARELAILEGRGYNPRRPDIARQLRENHLPGATVTDYRRDLHELGLKVGVRN